MWCGAARGLAIPQADRCGCALRLIEWHNPPNVLILIRSFVSPPSNLLALLPSRSTTVSNVPVGFVRHQLASAKVV